MKTVCCLLVLITGLFPALAAALTRDEAYELARSGDAEAIESAFAAHQAAFNEGEIGPNTYQWPYSIFWTTEPLVEITIDGWLAAYPDSPQAAAAKALRLRHIGGLVRGGDFAPKTPTAALTKFNRIASEALILAKRALESEPHHLAAAYSLMSLGAFLGSRADRDRGFQIIEELDTPADVLLFGLKYNYARWGGGPEATRLFCEERAPLVPDISVEECLAKADYDNAGQDRALQLSAINTLAKGSIEHFLEQHIAALGRSDRMEEAYALARSRNYMSRQFAYAAANGLRNMSIVEDFVAENLRNDPLNPLDLTAYAESHKNAGNRQEAWEAYDKALRYGAHSRNVRWARLMAMYGDPERGWGTLAELSDAIEATDGDIQIIGAFLVPLEHPTEHLTHLKDGTPNPEFECVRLRIFEMHKNYCDAGVWHHSCDTAMAIGRDIVINKARANNACGEETERTWQDVIRHLLDLTE